MILTLAFHAVLSQAAPAADADALRRTVQVEAAAIERSPDDTEALYRLGLAYLALGEAKKALGPLETLLKADADSVDAVLLLSRAYRASGELDKAKVLLDTAITSKPDVPTLRAERAHLARATDDYDTAVAQYSKAVELAPNDAALVFNLGEAQHKAGKNLDGVISQYRAALKLDPDLASAKVNLGKALAEKGLFGEAKEVLAAVNKTTLVDAEAHYNLGVILLRENNTTESQTQFERTLAANPKHAPALNNLGVVWDARGDHKKALDYFKKAALVDPMYTEAFFNQGMSYMKLNKPKEATRAFEQALKLEPAASTPYVKLGTLYLEQGKKERAVEAFKKAIATLDEEEKKAGGFKLLVQRFKAERSTDAYRGLALAFLQQGKVDDAVATLKDAAAKVPNDPSAWLALGEALLAKGDAEGAVDALKKRLQLEPSAEAQLDLARAYTKRRIAKEAEALYRDVLKAEPENRRAHLGLVDLFLEQGKYADAERLLKEQLQKDPNDAQSLARVGVMKSRQQRPDQALEPLEKAVALNPSLSEARAELAFLHFRADPAKAAQCVTTTSEIVINEPRNVLALSYLGLCLLSKGDKARAEQTLKAAIDIDKNFGLAHYNLAQVYENEGKLDDAKKAYQAAAALDFGDASDQLKRLNSGK